MELLKERYVLKDLQIPLNDDELERLENILFEHGNDDSILSLSELDGFLTALISAPQAELPSRWIGWIWGREDRQLAWSTEEQVAEFFNLLFRFQNTIADCLMRAPQDFEPLFMVNNLSDEEIFIAEDWCFGYMRGVDHLSWPTVPEALESWFYAIELHGRESNFEFLSTLSLEEHQNTVADIREAAVRLFQYNRFGLIDGVAAQARPVTSEKIGRNTPCPCGSGKKYKNCCLH